MRSEQRLINRRQWRFRSWRPIGPDDWRHRFASAQVAAQAVSLQLLQLSFLALDVYPTLTYTLDNFYPIHHQQHEQFPDFHCWWWIITDDTTGQVRGCIRRSGKSAALSELLRVSKVSSNN